MKPIKHQGCDGWAIYDSEYIEGSEPQNIHVVEAAVEIKPDGSVTATPNDLLETCCGRRKLVKSKRFCITASKSENVVREMLCKLQNEGHEVCGQCVATFYADTPEPTPGL